MAIVKILQIEHGPSTFTLINKLDGSPVVMHMTSTKQVTPVRTTVTERDVKVMRDMFGFRLERIL